MFSSVKKYFTVFCQLNLGILNLRLDFVNKSKVMAEQGGIGSPNSSFVVVKPQKKEETNFQLSSQRTQPKLSHTGEGNFRNLLHKNNTQPEFEIPKLLNTNSGREGSPQKSPPNSNFSEGMFSPRSDKLRGGSGLVSGERGGHHERGGERGGYHERGGDRGGYYDRGGDKGDRGKNSNRGNRGGVEYRGGGGEHRGGERGGFGDRGRGGSTRGVNNSRSNSDAPKPHGGGVASPNLPRTPPPPPPPRPVRQGAPISNTLEVKTEINPRSLKFVVITSISIQFLISFFLIFRDQRKRLSKQNQNVIVSIIRSQSF